MLLAVLGEHLLPTDGTDLPFHHQVALTDFIAAIFGYLDQCNGIMFIFATIQDSPEEMHIVQLPVIAKMLVSKFSV